MTRGEGRPFTERVSALLNRLGMPAGARDHYHFLADFFEHKRGFCKIEWQRGNDHTWHPLVACYFRRRPEIETILSEFQARQLVPAQHDALRLLGYHLDKRTVHFVAAGFRPDSPVHHKLYFSQYVTGHTVDKVEQQLARALQFVCECEHHPPLTKLASDWRPLHRTVIANTLDKASESTLFASVNLTQDGLEPWLKIDYPDVAPESAAAWVPTDERAQVMRDATTAARVVRRERLSFLGVRLRADSGRVTLKYYADFPDRTLIP